ncbi:TIGR00366 family protein, partial [bacterium]|nr:TIGR00366 family protein [bacterium]
VSATIFSPLNIVLALLFLISVPLLLKGMLPKSNENWEGYSGQRSSFEEPESTVIETPADWLENNRGITILISVLALIYLINHFAGKGLSGLNLNSMNLAFLFLGFLFFIKPIRYVKAVNQAVSGTAGIILQFPFYAGIMGMMKLSGLVDVFSATLVNISNLWTFPIFTFFSAGLVNLFVPSGGGQWAVQGPILVDAALQLGYSTPKTVMALAYGDQWTNMLQPFWALPLLAITGLKARQIIGYTGALMLLVIPLILLALLVS